MRDARWIIVGVVAAVSFVGCGIAMIVVGGIQVARNRLASGPSPAAMVRTAEEQREIAGAFTGAPLDENDETQKSIRLTLERMGIAIRTKDAAAVGDAFDMDRMFEELNRHLPVAQRLQNRDRTGFVAGAKATFAPALLSNPLFVWDKVEIRRLSLSADRSEAIVIARLRDSDGLSSKIRFWFVRRADRWRIFDFEDLDMGMRVSWIMTSAVGQGPSILAMRDEIPKLQQAAMAIKEGDVKTAKERFKLVRKQVVIPPLDRFYAVIEAALALAEGDAKRCIQVLDSWEARRGVGNRPVGNAAGADLDFPVADVLRSRAHHELKQHRKACDYASKYIASLGDDAEVYHLLGAALGELGEDEAAVDQLRRALNDDVDMDILKELRKHLPPEGKKELASHFAKLPAPATSFAELARDAYEARDYAAVTALIDAYRPISGGDKVVGFYRSLLETRRGRTDEAAKLFQAFLKRTPKPEEQESFFESFRDAMQQNGAAMTAYGLAPKPVEAFRPLARGEEWKGEVSQLAALVDAHAKRAPSDPWLPYFRGRLLEREKQWAAAANQFDRVATKDFADEDKSLVRYTHLRCLLQAADYKTAFAKYGKDYFNDVLAQSQAIEGAECLAAILELKRGQGEDLSLLTGQVELHIRNKQPALALAAYRKWIELRAKSKPPSPDPNASQAYVMLRHLALNGFALDAYRASSDASEAFQTLSGILRYRNDGEMLTKLIDTHRQKRPDDPRLAMVDGQLAEARSDWKQAASFFDRAREKLTEEYEKMAAARGQMTAAVHLGRAAETWRRASPDIISLNSLAARLVESADAEQMQALVREAEKGSFALKEGENPDFVAFAIEHLKMRLALLRGDAVEATVRYHAARARTQNRFHTYTSRTEFVNGMADLGKLREAYHECAAKRVAFSMLAIRFESSRNAGGLRELIGWHQAKYPDDEQIALRRALLHEWDHDLAGAEALLAKLASSEWGDLYQHRWWDLRIKQGRAAETYRTIGPRHFDELAWICVSTEKPDQLAELIAARRSEKPQSAELSRWEIEVAWLRRDYAQVVERARPILGGAENGFRDFSVRDRLVRSLVRLKRLDEAQVDLKKYSTGEPPLLHRVMIAAARRDMAAVEAGLVEWMRIDRDEDDDDDDRYGGNSPGTLFDDDDLGPLLRSPDFASIREKYPQPPEQLRIRPRPAR